MTRLNTNQVLGLSIALVSVGYLAMAFQIPNFPLPRPIDSDLFPKALGFILFALAVMLFLEKPQQRDISAAVEQHEQGGPLLLQPWARIVVTSLAIVAYALLLVPLGFVATSLVFSYGLAWYYGFQRHGVNLAVSLGVVLTLYLAMTRGMDVYLPSGILPF